MRTSNLTKKGDCYRRHHSSTEKKYSGTTEVSERHTAKGIESMESSSEKERVQKLQYAISMKV
jgi:hypothetical protein